MARSRACIKLPQLEFNGEHGWNKREQERQETCVQIYMRNYEVFYPCPIVGSPFTVRA